MTSPSSLQQTPDTTRGLAFAVSAYLLWGFFPLYFKLLGHVGAVEIVAHRVVWSVPLAGAVLLILGRTKDIGVALHTPRMLAMGLVSAALVSVNWSIYVYAIVTDQALEAALGYYINPLFSVFLGAALLGERLTRLQWVAVGLAAVAVAVLAIEAGHLPIIALGLTFSWGLYALAKKQLPIGPNQGFMLEVLILLPAAVVYLLWLGPDNLFAASWSDTWLLIGCGAVTAVPLLLYANGAKGLRLTTIAVLQYIVPTMVFLLAVFVFDEPVGRGRAIAFPLIWAALVLYTFTLIRRRR